MSWGIFIWLCAGCICAHRQGKTLLDPAVETRDSEWGQRGSGRGFGRAGSTQFCRDGSFHFLRIALAVWTGGPSPLHPRGCKCSIPCYVVQFVLSLLGVSFLKAAVQQRLWSREAAQNTSLFPALSVQENPNRLCTNAFPVALLLLLLLLLWAAGVRNTEMLVKAGKVSIWTNWLQEGREECVSGTCFVCVFPRGTDAPRLSHARLEPWLQLP